MKTIYLDNAATTYPKPRSVIRAAEEALQKIGGNPGRGSHRLSTAAAETVYECRVAAAKMFGAEPECVVFTMNATHALNFAIKGLAKSGCHILIDNYAHNAAYRPVVSLANAGIAEYDVYDASGDGGETISDISKKLRPNTSIVIATHQSNICSHVLPIEEIGHFCAEHGLYFIVDASQSAGHIPIDMKQMNITSLCMPGHKGLYSPMGVGMLISSPDISYQTVIEGGAGIHSLDSVMPEELPEHLEAGTLPLSAIAGLLSGIRFVERIGIDEIHLHECTLTSELCDRLNAIPEVTVYGESLGSVVGFCVNKKSPAEVGAYLSSRGICVRTGYHCAPLAHRTVGSFDGGSVRVGVSYFNTMSDIRAVSDAISDMGYGKNICF